MNSGEAIGMMAGAYFVSRAELLNWINDLTALNYTKIEQTANGVFACHVFDALFPGEIRLEKVNFRARQQYEFVHNYKVLQAAFKRLNLKKEIDVQKLIKSKYQDNLEFMQWVKAFYDSHASENALQYDGRSRREAILAKGRTHARPALSSNRATDNPVRTGAYSAAPRVAKARSAAAERPRPSGPTVKKAEFDALKAQFDTLKEENERLSQTIADGDTERDFYFNKLRDVEVIVQDMEEDFASREDPVDEYISKAVDQIKEVLYAEDDVGARRDTDQGVEAEQQEFEDEGALPEEVLPEEAAHQELTAGNDY